MARQTSRRQAVLRRARAIARKQPWCDARRVAECSPGCLCREEAGRWLRGLQAVNRAKTLKGARQAARGALNPVRKRRRS